ncbi:MAG: lytic transglycosylase domain-containing protein [Firmicutes bacterium]|nr:lytic transglycosylase domain-containing protein [Bacillota bacterium]
MAKFKKIILICAILFAVFLTFNAVLKKLYPALYMDIIIESAKQYNLDPLLILSVIRAESNFSEYAISHKEAKGLMQLKSDTARWCAQQMGDGGFTEEKIYEPRTNIQIGVWYLNYLIEQFEGNCRLGITAYNAGIGNVKKWLENTDYSANGNELDKIPFRETERYIKRVLNNYAIYKMLY